MRTYRKSKGYARPAKNAPAPKPLDSAQLNAVLRIVFPWMTVGMGITAFVASLLGEGGSYAENFDLLRALALAIIVLLGLSFALNYWLHRLSPTAAGLFFVIFSALAGFCFALFCLVLTHPYAYDTALIASLSTASLFGGMTLAAWKSKLDLSKNSSFLLMGALGALVTAALNFFLGSGSAFDLIMSFSGVLLFTALTASSRQPIAQMAVDQRMTIKPDDSLHFSVLAALKLYLSSVKLLLILPFYLLPGTWARRGNPYRYMGTPHYPHHSNPHHYGNFGSSHLGSGGGVGGSVGGGGGGSGGGGSFTA